MFNALKYTKRLEEVGFTRDQAEAHMQMMTEIMETNLATSQDLKDVRVAVQQDIKDLRADVQQDIKDLRADVQQDIKDLRNEFYSVKTDVENKIIQSEYRLTIKLGTIVSLAIGAAVALAKIV